MMTIGDRIKQLRKFYPAFVAAQKTGTRKNSECLSFSSASHLSNTKRLIFF